MSTLWLSLLSKRASSFAVVSKYRRLISVRHYQYGSSIPSWQEPLQHQLPCSRLFATKAAKDDDDNNNNNNNNSDAPSPEPTPKLTRSEIRRLRVMEMRKELTALGLDATGTGKAMVKQLLEAMHGPPPADGSSKRHATSISKPIMPIMTKDKDSAVGEAPATGASTTIPSDVQFDPAKVYVLRFRGHTTTSYSNAGVGLVLYDVESQEKVWSGRKYFEEDQSRFEAEYRGLAIGLKVALSKGVQRLVLQGDNHVILRQLEGTFNVQKEELKRLYWTTVALKEQFVGLFEVQPINSIENSVAHLLASRAVATKKSYNLEGQDLHWQTPEEKQAEIADAKEGDRARASSSDTTTNEATTLRPLIKMAAPITGGAAANFVAPSEAEEQQYDTVEPGAAVNGDATTASPETHAEADDGIDPASVIDPQRRYLMQFDGGSRGNPGLAGAGMVIYDDNKQEVWCGWKYLDYRATNNDAEYTGLIVGLKCALSLGITNLRVEGDSELIVRQLEGRYRVKDGRLRELWKESKELIPGFDFIEIRHIPRAKNKRADELANAAMDSRESFGFEDTAE